MRDFKYWLKSLGRQPIKPPGSQKQLLDAIKRASKPDSESKITYHSEWLGYLPYGCYHWVCVDDEDISATINEMDGVETDLEHLSKLGLLIEVRRHTNPEDEFEKLIEYKIAG